MSPARLTDEGRVECYSTLLYPPDICEWTPHLMDTPRPGRNVRALLRDRRVVLGLLGLYFLAAAFVGGPWFALFTGGLVTLALGFVWWISRTKRTQQFGTAALVTGLLLTGGGVALGNAPDMLPDEALPYTPVIPRPTTPIFQAPVATPSPEPSSTWTPPAWSKPTPSAVTRPSSAASVRPVPRPSTQQPADPATSTVPTTDPGTDPEQPPTEPNPPAEPDPPVGPEQPPQESNPEPKPVPPGDAAGPPEG